MITVPCEICGDPTPMTGTKRCDRCFELEGRILSDPQLAWKILSGGKTNPPRKRRGPPPGTGRYATRDELVDAINRDYYGNKNTTMSSIARACRVSNTLVGRILSAKEGYDRWVASRG